MIMPAVHNLFVASLGKFFQECNDIYFFVVRRAFISVLSSYCLFVVYYLLIVVAICTVFEDKESSKLGWTGYIYQSG